MEKNNKFRRTFARRSTTCLHMDCHTANYWIYSVLIFLACMCISIFIEYRIVSNYETSNREIVNNQYLYFQKQIDALINTGEKLLAGYEAFFLSSDHITTEESEQFIVYLLRNYEEFVKNIAVVEDTTIAYNFPYEENKGTIGVNLATIEGQKESVLKVKNEHVTSFQGPIDLIQGKKGYVIRVPLMDKNNEYWGQVSMILYYEAVNAAILEYAEQQNLDIAIYESHNLDTQILGDPSILDHNPMRFDETNQYGWIIYANSKDYESDFLLTRIRSLLIGMMLSMIVALLYILNKKSHLKLQYLNAHDQLTDLYNRRHLETIQNMLSKYSEKNLSSYGLLHIDVDQFKYINDHYGHLVGDQVLREISRVLKIISRKNEAVFRIGGDEFLVIIPEVINSTTEIEQMRHRYEHDFEQEFNMDVCPDFAGISIGIALFHNDGVTFGEVLKAADEDMYQVKMSHKAKRQSL